MISLLGPRLLLKKIRDYLDIERFAKIILNKFLRKEDGTHFSKVYLRRKLMKSEIISCS